MLIGIDASRANIAERTGTERYAFEVIRRLCVSMPEHQLRLYTREPLRPEWGSLPSNVTSRVLTWRPGLLWSHLRLSWEMLWHRPEVLFVPADTVPIFHPRFTVTTIHDVAFERFPELYRRGSVQRKLGWLRPLVHIFVRIATLGRYSASERDYHRWSIRQAARACTRILTVSEFSKREICDVLKLSPNRVTVTPLGVRQPDYFTQSSIPETQQILHELGITQPYIFFVGRLEKKKNIGPLLVAYHQYRETHRDAPILVLAGTPGFGWEEAAQQYGLEGVWQLGWQDDRHVDALMQQASCFVFISQYEGFGIPAAEALSAGVPVIASHNGSLPDVLGPAAYYVHPEAIDDVVRGLDRILHDQGLRQTLIALGKQQVHTYTWDRTAELTKQVILNPNLPKA